MRYARALRALAVTTVVAATLALAPSASAAAPVIRSVTYSGKFIKATWTLPEGVRPASIEIGDDPTPGYEGHFLGNYLVGFSPLEATQTSYTDDTPLEPGTYYVQISRFRSVPLEWSRCWKIQIRADRQSGSGSAGCTSGGGGGGGGGGGDGGGGGGGGKVASFSLSFPRSQDVDKLYVTGRMGEAGTLTATAKVTVSGASKVYRFKTAKRSARANVRTKLRLKLRKTAKGAVKSALRGGRRLKAKVTVTARDRAGNKLVKRATIRLRP